jgi:transcriptional regulator with XRE-family HTH domain
MPRRPRENVVSLKDIGGRVRALRNERGMTQSELASILATHQTNVSEIERGVRGLTIHQLVKLSRSLRTTPNDLLAEGAKNLGRGRTRRNGRLLRRLQEISELPKAEQQAIQKILDRVLQAHGQRSRIG